MNDTPPRTMSAGECWQALREHEFGRLAYRLLGDVHITPINYAVDGDALLFRTAQGNKLLSAVMHEPVALEIDELGSEDAWSVVVRGRAEVLGETDAQRAEQVPLRPWVAGDKDSVVRIVAVEVTGRRFRLSKPWEHIVPTS
ncbi:pyridoxamine 5'-phosphate oxidase family protein [Janibacter alittae]|uniref:Pyridoxamine 5'-phosphate oxidase family protein n=1 Tax=Janibacter alittae TaxID=3115209 RepID=A0ABZ2MDX5_9MICO